MLYSKKTINSRAYFFVPDHTDKQAFMTILIYYPKVLTGHLGFITFLQRQFCCNLCEDVYAESEFFFYHDKSI